MIIIDEKINMKNLFDQNELKLESDNTEMTYENSNFNLFTKTNDIIIISMRKQGRHILIDYSLYYFLLITYKYGNNSIKKFVRNFESNDYDINCAVNLQCPQVIS